MDLIIEHIIYTKFKLDAPHPTSGNIYLSDNIRGLLGDDFGLRRKLENNRLWGAIGGRDLVGKLVEYDQITHLVKDIFITPSNELACRIRTLRNRAGIGLAERLAYGDEFMIKFIILGEQQSDGIIMIDEILYAHLSPIGDL